MHQHAPFTIFTTIFKSQKFRSAYPISSLISVGYFCPQHYGALRILQGPHITFSNIRKSSPSHRVGGGFGTNVGFSEFTRTPRKDLSAASSKAVATAACHVDSCGPVLTWESKVPPPPKATPPRNKALIRSY